MVKVMPLPITDKPSTPLLPLPLPLEKCLSLVHLFQHFMVVSFVGSIVVFSMMVFSMVVIPVVMVTPGYKVWSGHSQAASQQGQK